MENAIKAAAVQAELSRMQAQLNTIQAELSRIQAQQDCIRGLLEGSKAKEAPRLGSTSVLSPGQFDRNGFKPWQGIKEVLKRRGNLGVSQDDIVRDLVTEGTLLKDKKYPKRSVSLSIVNSPETFEERDGLIYLRSETATNE